MILAAGLGTRMRPLTDTLPKPLVKVAGRPLIDHVLDRLAEAGVERVVVNVHHLADQMQRHLAQRKQPQIVISDERGLLLGTGGGVKKALPELGDAPFFHINSDTIWIDGVKPNLARLADAFDPAAMDALLLLAPTNGSIGYSGRGDFAMAADGQLRKRAEQEVAPFVYAGAAILSPALFKSTPEGELSLTTLFDRAAQARRLHGLRMEGLWMHVGTPEAIASAEAAIKASTSLNSSVCFADDHWPQRLQYSSVSTIPAGADQRTAQWSPGQRISGFSRSARTCTRHALSADAAGLPAGARCFRRNSR